VEPTSWADFKRLHFRWNQSEHISILAPTGGGKTTLERQLIPYRKFNLFLATKPFDKEYDRLIKEGFKRVQSVKDIRPGDKNIILWPKPGKTIPETVALQVQVFREAFNYIVKTKHWTVWVDESKYMNEHLKLKLELTYCLEQLRSMGGTIICAGQRPAYFPASALPNSTHVFIWKTTSYVDAKRLADIGGVDARQVMDILKTLDDYEFLYIRSRGTASKIIRTQVKEG
jgi:hypothetical protein